MHAPICYINCTDSIVYSLTPYANGSERVNGLVYRVEGQDYRYNTIIIIYI